MSLNTISKETRLINNRLSTQNKNRKASTTPVNKKKKEISSINQSILSAQEKIKNLKALLTSDPKNQKKKEELMKEIEKDVNLQSYFKVRNSKLTSIPNKESQVIQNKINITKINELKTYNINDKPLDKLNKITTAFEKVKTAREVKKQSRNLDLNQSISLRNSVTPTRTLNISLRKSTPIQIRKTNSVEKNNAPLKMNSSMQETYLKRPRIPKEVFSTMAKKNMSMDWSDIKALSDRGSLREKELIEMKIKKLNPTKTNLPFHKNIKSENKTKVSTKIAKLPLRGSKIIVNKNISYTSIVTNDDVNNYKKDDDISCISTSNITANNSNKLLKKIRHIHEITKVGYAGANQKKINQDNYFVFKNFSLNEESIFFGVCDGHGSNGHEVSKYLKENLPETLKNEIHKKFTHNGSNPLNKIIEEVFLEMNNDLFLEMGIDTNFSGSTCCSLIYTPDKLVCANVGDSRCVLGRYVNDEWKPHSMSRDHKPNDKDESERISSKNGRIEPYKDSDGSYIGPMRVWLKEENIPGLAMSRSFGDKVAYTVGVVAMPEIIEWTFTKEDKFIVIASDGIWEFISNEECVDIVKEFYVKNDVVGACEFLVEEATRYWLREDTIIDDITVIVVFLDN